MVEKNKAGCICQKSSKNGSHSFVKSSANIKKKTINKPKKQNKNSTVSGAFFE